MPLPSRRPDTLRTALLAACSLAALAAGREASAQAVNSVAVNGGTLVNQGLVGVGRLPANMRDGLGETFGSVSGMVPDASTWRRQGDSYTGTLYFLPDRGYNAVGTTDYSNRVNKMGVTLTPNYGGSNATGQNQIQLKLEQTIPLTEQNGTPLSGIDAAPKTGVRPASAGLPALPQGFNGKIALDPEGIVRMTDGSFFISDEYGPNIYRFSGDGKLLSAIRPPDALIPTRNGVQDFSSNNPAAGQPAPVPADPVTGRQNNQGLEGLALSADGKTLTALLQSATRQDGGNGANTGTRLNTRMLTYDVSNPAAPVLTGHYVVQLPTFRDSAGVKVAAQSEMLALNDRQFLVLSRDSGNGSGLAGTTSLYRSIDFVDISGATNLVNTPYNGTTPVAPNGALVASVTPVRYSQFLDMNNNAQLGRFGLRNGAPNDRNNLSEKWEAMGLLPALDPAKPDDFFLFVGNDNDFLTTQGFQVGAPYNAGVDVDTMLLAFRLTLPTYVDPLAVQSLRNSALPLIRGIGNMSVSLTDAHSYMLNNRLATLHALGTSQRTQPFEIFASGTLDYDHTKENAVEGGTRPSSYGGMVGGDVRLNENLTAGLALGVQRTDGKFKGLGDAKATSYSVNPYLAANYGRLFGDLSFSYARNDIDRISRDTGAYGLTAKGDTKGHSWAAGLNGGYELGSGNWSYGPTAGVRYVSTKVDGYTERDAIHLNAVMPNQTLDGWVWQIGGQVARRFVTDGNIEIVPSFRAGYEWNRIDGSNSLTASLANRQGMSLASVTSSFPRIDRDGMRLGTGISLGFGALAWQLNYDVKFTGSYADHSLLTGVRYAF